MAERRGVRRTPEQHRPVRNRAGRSRGWARDTSRIAIAFPDDQLYRAGAFQDWHCSGQCPEPSKLQHPGLDAERLHIWDDHEFTIGGGGRSAPVTAYRAHHVLVSRWETEEHAN